MVRWRVSANLSQDSNVAMVEHVSDDSSLILDMVTGVKYALFRILYWIILYLTYFEEYNADFHILSHSDDSSDIPRSLSHADWTEE